MIDGAILQNWARKRNTSLFQVKPLLRPLTRQPKWCGHTVQSLQKVGKKHKETKQKDEKAQILQVQHAPQNAMDSVTYVVRLFYLCSWACNG